MHSPQTRKCALFVDFDNIFIGLRDDSKEAANVFATNPGRWLNWLEHGLGRIEAGGEGNLTRSILVRRCYLNPNSFRNFRADFTRAGFTVVDCPPLTGGAKNSADIVMVMDILDALEHKTRFDEFIIMSGDADFTPVFYRLRAYDRRITALVSTPTAAAFRSACDLLISEEIFVERALGIAISENGEAEKPGADLEILAAMADRLLVAARPNGQIPAEQLPQYYKEFPVFRSNYSWLGFGSLRTLTEAVIATCTQLAITDEGTTWVVTLAESDAITPTEAAAGEADRCEPAASATGPEDRLRDLPQTLADFIRRVSRLTDAPRLRPEDYHTLFATIAEEVNHAPFNLVATSKAVRDACGAADRTVSRTAVNWVLKGLIFGGYDLNSPDRIHRPGEMADAFYHNVRALLEQARAELTEEEEGMLRQWLLGESAR